MGNQAGISSLTAQKKCSNASAGSLHLAVQHSAKAFALATGVLHHLSVPILSGGKRGGAACCSAPVAAVNEESCDGDYSYDECDFPCSDYGASAASSDESSSDDSSDDGPPMCIRDCEDFDVIDSYGDDDQYTDATCEWVMTIADDACISDCSGEELEEVLEFIALCNGDVEFDSSSSSDDESCEAWAGELIGAWSSCVGGDERLHRGRVPDRRRRDSRGVPGDGRSRDGGLQWHDLLRSPERRQPSH